MRVTDVLERVMKGELSWTMAGQILGYTPRHMRRLRTTLLQDGIDGVRDKRCGRVMPHRVPEKQVAQILKLRRERYPSYNVRHLRDTLETTHRIKVSYTYLRTLLQRAGLYHGGKEKGLHRMRRQRRPCRGMMLHIDGSEHAWLGEAYGRRDLILIQDDADSRILYGRIVREEGTKTCLAGISAVLERYGLFSELYSDRGSHFAVTKKAGGRAEAGNVQIARILKKLGIQAIYAYSPEARGRSERTFGTFQDRFCNELAAEGITRWQEANRYLTQVFIPDYNRRFTVTPERPESAFLSTNDINLKRACALEHSVTIGKDNCVRWQQQIFQVPAQPSRATYARCKATLVEYLDDYIDIEYGTRIIARFNPDGIPLTLNSLRRLKAKKHTNSAIVANHYQHSGHL